RRDQATGRHIDVGTEGADAIVGVALGIGVDGNVALVQVRDDGVWQRARGFLVVGFAVGQLMLGNQHGDRGPVRLVVLARDVEDVGANDLDHIGKDLGQTFGVVHLVDIINIGFTLFFGLRVT